MKSVLIISVLLVILCSVANAMVVRGGMYRDPNHPGMCAVGHNMILQPGQVLKKPNGECAILTCYANGQVSTMTCQEPGMRPGCTIGLYTHPHAEYPQCCQREIQCQDGYYSNNFLG